MSKNKVLMIPTEKFLSEEIEHGPEFLEDLEEFITFHEHPDIIKEIEKAKEEKKKHEDEKFKQLMDRLTCDEKIK
jgi:hypothetical protein